MQGDYGNKEKVVGAWRGANTQLKCAHPKKTTTAWTSGVTVKSCERAEKWKTQQVDSRELLAYVCAIY
jgi:hypothetical protein